MKTFGRFIINKKRNCVGGKAHNVGGFSNLNKAEQLGLKSLRNRIKSGELIIGQSDKSSRLCVMNRQQYIDSGTAHTKHDQQIDWKTVKTLQNRVNATVWWLSMILNQSKFNDQQR